MKSRIEIEQVPVKPFPKLMKCTTDNTVIFFSDHGVGIVVYAENQDCIGEDSDEWIMDGFVDFDGQIVLSN